MIEEGKVVKIEDNTAKIKLRTREECSGCSLASFCELTKEGERYIEIEGETELKIGDKVKVEIERIPLLAPTALLFLIPASSFIIGAAIGQKIREGVLFPFATGIIFLAFAFFFLHIFDKKLAPKKGKARIVAKISN